jgi:3-keto steroid reductase
MIDEFLAKRSLSSHLILIPTARSVRKSRETIEALRKHLYKSANSEAVAVRARSLSSDSSYDPQDTINRVHLLAVQVDLCSLDSIYGVADQLVGGTVGDPTDKTGTEYTIPKLDAVILNAGFGGWTHVHWPGLIRMFLTKGLIQMCTWPTFKVAEPGRVVSHKSAKGGEVRLTLDYLAHSSSHSLTGFLPQSSPHVLGEVFCSNVFGHYVLVHELLPLLSRASPSEAPGRIIWTSSVEPAARHFSLDDPQGIKSRAPYESSKRLTDLLALTYRFPASQKQGATSFLTIEDAETRKAKPYPPVILLTHPGIVHSALFPLTWALLWLYKLAMYLTRWIGSPWHPVTGYLGATASVWAVLEEDLETQEVHKVKWGSSTDVWGNALIKTTEVEGWGWDGTVVTREELEKEKAARVMRRLSGRRGDCVDTTAESRVEFEEVGAKAWGEMERLRREWDGITGRR